MHKTVCVLFGSPGAGKTVLGKAFKTLGFETLTTSDVLRRESIERTALGAKITAFIDSGKLVPDDIVLQVVTRRLLESINGNPLLLDGFPRTTLQADYFVRWTKSVQADVHVLKLCIDPEIAIAESISDPDRKDRTDNTRETMLMRFDVFEKETRPVLDELGEFFPGRIHTVDAQPGVRTKVAHILGILGWQKDISHLPDEPRGVNVVSAVTP